MKKRFIQFLSLVLAISFFLCNSRPVLADFDYDTYTIDPSQALAYIYWNNCGFNLTQTLSNSTNIAVPAFRTDTGNTNDRLICNASGTSYSCYYLGSSGNQGTFQYETTRAHDETVQNISVHGAEIPWLSGNYVHESGWSWSNNYAYMAYGDTLYVSVISTTNMWTSQEYSDSNIEPNHWVRGWNEANTSIPVRRVNTAQVKGGFLYTLAIGPNTYYGRNNIVLDFPAFNSSTKIIPLYIGLGNDLTDEMKQMIGIETKTEAALNTIAENSQQNTLAVQRQNSLSEYGNANSQTAQNNLTTSNNQLGHSVNHMNTIETGYNDDLNAALDDIDLSTDLVQHTGFTNAALWVSAQFNRLVVGTPFELVMTFSLITGLALVLIGKMRG